MHELRFVNKWRQTHDQEGGGDLCELDDRDLGAAVDLSEDDRCGLANQGVNVKNGGRNLGLDVSKDGCQGSHRAVLGLDVVCVI